MTSPTVTTAEEAAAHLEQVAPDHAHGDIEVLRPAPNAQANAAVAAAADAALAMPGVAGRDEFLSLAMQARMLALSAGAPKAVRDNPFLAFHIAMVGRDLGISPSAAIELIDVIETRRGSGEYRLSLSPQLLNGQILRLGLGIILPVVKTRERCVAVALAPHGNIDHRCRPTWPTHWEHPTTGDPCKCDGLIGDSEFTWADAIIAQLVMPDCTPDNHKCLTRDRKCNSGYVKYPQRMMWWRAAGYAADDYFPQAGLGLYTAEELGAVVDADGRPVDPSNVDLPPGYEAPRTDAEKQAERDADPTDPEELAALVDARHSLMERITLLPDAQRGELRERWMENERLRPWKPENLPKSQLRLVNALLQGFESAAKAAGWDPDLARSDASAIGAAIAALYGYGPDTAPDGPAAPPEPPSGQPPPTPPEPAGSPADAAQAPDATEIAGPREVEGPIADPIAEPRETKAERDARIQAEKEAAKVDAQARLAALEAKATGKGTLPLGDPGSQPPPELAPAAAPAPAAARPAMPNLDELAVKVRAAVDARHTDPCTPKQRGAVAGILGGWGITERPDRLAALERLYGRPFTTSNELTKGEAGALIDVAPSNTGDDAVDRAIDQVRAMPMPNVVHALKEARLSIAGNDNAKRLRLAEHLIGRPVTKQA